MYSEAAQPLMEPKAQSSTPVFQSILERFEKQNSWQIEMISKIEDKLHQLLNRRTPEKADQKDNVPLIKDATEAYLRQLSTMEMSCYRLEGILKHLNEIA